MKEIAEVRDLTVNLQLKVGIDETVVHLHCTVIVAEEAVPRVDAAARAGTGLAVRKYQFKDAKKFSLCNQWYIFISTIYFLLIQERYL